MPGRKRFIKNCKSQGCVRAHYCRGLCRSCYTALQYRVSSGETTWEELERLHVCEPSERQHPPALNDYMRARKQEQIDNEKNTKRRYHSGERTENEG